MFLQGNGVNLLSLRAVDPAKYALQLMEVLFTEDEMATSCYIASHRTKKPGLNKQKVLLLEGTNLVVVKDVHAW